MLLLQKMSEWVAVCADEAEEPVEIPTEADGEFVSTFAKIPTKGEEDEFHFLKQPLLRSQFRQLLSPLFPCLQF